MAAILAGGDNGEYLKSGERQVFVGGDGRRDVRCVSGSAVVGGEYQIHQGTCQPSRETRSYSFLCPLGSRGRRTTEVAEAETKR